MTEQLAVLPTFEEVQLPWAKNARHRKVVQLLDSIGVVVEKGEELGTVLRGRQFTRFDDDRGRLGRKELVLGAMCREAFDSMQVDQNEPTPYTCTMPTGVDNGWGLAVGPIDPVLTLRITINDNGEN